MMQDGPDPPAKLGFMAEFSQNVFRSGQETFLSVDCTT